MPWGLRTAACILLGVLLAWGTAAALLTRSGDGIAARSAAVEQAGGLVVPGMRVRPDPGSREAAWWGGLFFALGLGAALGWCGAVGAAAWVLALRRRPRALAGMAAIWIAALAWAAWPPGGAAAPFFLLIPIPCFALAAGAMQKCPPRRVSLLAGLVIPLLLLGGAWAHLSRSGGWLDVRDFLLWPHPAGRAIVDGYYRYTLTPAEFIKPLERRQIRTARVVAPGRPDLEASLTDMLRARDYLPVPDDAPLDLVLKADRDALDLERNSRLLLRVPERLFLDSPDWVLSWFFAKGRPGGAAAASDADRQPLVGAPGLGHGVFRPVSCLVRGGRRQPGGRGGRGGGAAVAGGGHPGSPAPLPPAGGPGGGSQGAAGLGTAAGPNLRAAAGGEFRFRNPRPARLIPNRPPIPIPPCDTGPPRPWAAARPPGPGPIW